MIHIQGGPVPNASKDTSEQQSESDAPTRQGDRGAKATPEGGSEATGTKASKRAKQPAEYKKNHLKVKNFKKF
jgi:hypothetical protein